MRLLAEFSDDRFLDAFRDILRDTLTATSIMMILFVTIKQILPDPDFLDGIFLIMSLLFCVLIIIWYGHTINRSILVLENVFEGSRYFHRWRIIWAATGCFLVLSLAYTLGGAIAGIIRVH
ncbi:hypothetical protein [Kosakonia cowanii]|jgi:hypothetical protein|uniref:hypothetical protein n=1 Tax=Kosakonia cowanii TaxID=208223 RepID=UPI00289D59D5|nr:hypothetical protein [Kosakonia cowanii]